MPRGQQSATLPDSLSSPLSEVESDKRTGHPLRTTIKVKPNPRQCLHLSRQATTSHHFRHFFARSHLHIFTTSQLHNSIHHIDPSTLSSPSTQTHRKASSVLSQRQSRVDHDLSECKLPGDNGAGVASSVDGAGVASVGQRRLQFDGAPFHTTHAFHATHARTVYKRMLLAILLLV
jgi:hypothetical protein